MSRLGVEFLLETSSLNKQRNSSVNIKAFAKEGSAAAVKDATGGFNKRSKGDDLRWSSAQGWLFNLQQQRS